MVLALFDSKGLIYTNYVPKGSTVTASYIVEALGKFLKVFRQKRPGTGSSIGTTRQFTPLPW
jgi:hypothetical protein